MKTSEAVLFLKKKNQKNFCSASRGVFNATGLKQIKVFARFFQKAPLTYFSGVEVC